MLAILFVAAGCDDVGARAMREVAEQELCASTEPGTGAWETAPWRPPEGCTWLDYDGRTALEIPHPLGRRPRSVTVYISFTPEGRRATLAAGDPGRILEVTGTHVTISNATNQDFFARVVLH
jgi:hypothetical protein